MCETSSSEVEIVEDCSLINDAETPSAKKAGPGRRKSAVWVHFKEGVHDKKKKRSAAECLHCSAALDGKPSTLERHNLETCTDLDVR